MKVEERNTRGVDANQKFRISTLAFTPAWPYRIANDGVSALHHSDRSYGVIGSRTVYALCTPLSSPKEYLSYTVARAESGQSENFLTRHDLTENTGPRTG